MSGISRYFGMLMNGLDRMLPIRYGKYSSALRARLGKINGDSISGIYMMVHSIDPVFSTISEMVRDRGKVTLKDVLNVAEMSFEGRLSRDSLRDSIKDWIIHFREKKLNWGFGVSKRNVEGNRTWGIRNTKEDDLVFYEGGEGYSIAS
jgi:hypothetical protein